MVSNESEVSSSEELTLKDVLQALGRIEVLLRNQKEILGAKARYPVLGAAQKAASANGNLPILGEESDTDRKHSASARVNSSRKSDQENCCPKRLG